MCCLELSGNVWEWTGTKHVDYPYRPDEREIEDASDDERVLRGGSWSFNQFSARAAYRLFSHPYNRNLYYGGLRVVVRCLPSH